MDEPLRTAVLGIDLVAGLLWICAYARGGRNPAGPGPIRTGLIFRLFRLTHIPVAGVAAVWAIWSVGVAPPVGRVQVLGSVIAVLGVGLCVWARNELGQNYSPCFAPRAPLEIVRSGPYALVPHPIYVGNLCALAGFLIQGQAIWPFVAWLHWAFTYSVSARGEAGVIAAFAGREER